MSEDVNQTIEEEVVCDYCGGGHLTHDCPLRPFPSEVDDDAE